MKPMKQTMIRSVPVLALLAMPALAETVDNCASLLGSIAVELRIAHSLAPTARTSFTCPRGTRALIGTSRQRVLNSLGTPDASASSAGGSAGSWTYYFTGAHAGERGAGIPALTFGFDSQFEVATVNCERTTGL